MSIARRRMILNMFCPLLGAFAKLRKTLLVSSCVYVRPSVHMVQLGSHGTNFHENFILFEHLSRKFKFLYSMTRIRATVHKDQYTFSIIRRSILIRMRNVSDESCRENRNTNVVFCNFFRRSCRL